MKSKIIVSCTAIFLIFVMLFITPIFFINYIGHRNRVKWNEENILNVNGKLGETYYVFKQKKLLLKLIDKKTVRGWVEDHRVINVDNQKLEMGDVVGNLIMDTYEINKEELVKIGVITFDDSYGSNQDLASKHNFIICKLNKNAMNAVLNEIDMDDTFKNYKR